VQLVVYQWRQRIVCVGPLIAQAFQPEGNVSGILTEIELITV
jgi:hypothetical protein